VYDWRLKRRGLKASKFNNWMWFSHRRILFLRDQLAKVIARQHGLKQKVQTEREKIKATETRIENVEKSHLTLENDIASDRQLLSDLQCKGNALQSSVATVRAIMHDCHGKIEKLAKAIASQVRFKFLRNIL
jgi:chromosome segregation ATPase